MSITETEQKLLDGVGYELPKNREIAGIEFPDGILIYDFDMEIPPGIPQKPIALGSDSLTNRDYEDDSQLMVSVSKEVEESDTLGWFASFSTATTQEVAYGAAPGAGVSGKTSVTVEIEAGVNGSHTETNSVTRSGGISHPVNPRTFQRVNFVVEERRVDRIPWKAFLRPKGKANLKLETTRMSIDFFSEPNFGGERYNVTIKNENAWRWVRKTKYPSGLSLANHIGSLKVRGGTLVLYKHHLPCNDPQAFKPGDYPRSPIYTHGARFHPKAQFEDTTVDFSDFQGIPIDGAYRNLRISEGRWEVEEGIPI